ncbi:hypothetical protein FZEAL_7574 [Fusarium zealandicum]|uniref:Uncharacterized protein n=1 Tax=Fusarium zealandicum TaxID=1053134 RepID=A0A8H4UGB7_9HYPO|nr:hypothetical protein FZEAL_7574 [Fusarium zealandicum]
MFVDSSHILHAALLVSAVAKVSLAQSNDSTTGCSELDCPGASSGTANNCTIVDKSFTVIGLADIPANSSSSFSGLSWVKGVAEDPEESSDDNRVFDQTFYLGTSSEANIDGDIGACALFFNSITNAGPSEDDQEEGTCKDVLSKGCISALNDRAKNINFRSLSDAEACTKLKEEFKSHLDSECSSFSSGKTWANITSKVLSGRSAPQPITSKQNSTSNCWPIQPKSSNLTLVESIKTSGDYSTDFAEAQLHGYTPILTIFFPGNSSTFVGSESYVTCMKSLGDSVENEKTKDSGESEDEDDSSGSTFRDSYLVPKILAACVFIFYIY